MDREEFKQINKEALKEAYKEIVAERLAEVGLWTIRAVAVVVASAVIYALVKLAALGWRPPLP